MKRILLLYIFFVLIASACTPVVKTLYGIKKPAIENEQSILKYAKKIGLEEERICCFFREDWVWAIQEKEFAKSIPDMIIFDHEGHFLKVREEGQCNALNETVISSLVPGKYFEIDDSVFLTDISSVLRTLNGEPYEIRSAGQVDFVIFVFWTKYTGRLNKTKVLAWQQEVKNNTGCKIDFYLVNMDQQQWWGE
jgi:hypothetical protein